TQHALIIIPKSRRPLIQSEFNPMQTTFTTNRRRTPRPALRRRSTPISAAVSGSFLPALDCDLKEFFPRGIPKPDQKCRVFQLEIACGNPHGKNPAPRPRKTGFFPRPFFAHPLEKTRPASFCRAKRTRRPEFFPVKRKKPPLDQTANTASPASVRS